MAVHTSELSLKELGLGCLGSGLELYHIVYGHKDNTLQ